MPAKQVPRKAGARRPVRKTPAKKPEALGVDPEGLSPGDSIEHSISMEIRGPAGALWLKHGVTTIVRPHETGGEAEARAERFVSKAIERKAQAIISGKE